MTHTPLTLPTASPPPPRIFLNAGDFHFGAAPLQLETLLGSCATVTLLQPRRKIGGMCHFLVSSRAKIAGAVLDGHFADEAFALFDLANGEVQIRFAEKVKEPAHG